MSEMPDIPQPTERVAPLAESVNLDDLIDDEGRIVGSPANDEADE